MIEDLYQLYVGRYLIFFAQKCFESLYQISDAFDCQIGLSTK